MLAECRLQQCGMSWCSQGFHPVPPGAHIDSSQMLPSPFDNMQGGAASVASIPSSMQSAPAPSLGPGRTSSLRCYLSLLLHSISPIGNIASNIHHGSLLHQTYCPSWRVECLHNNCPVLRLNSSLPSARRVLECLAMARGCLKSESSVEQLVLAW